MHDKHGSWCGVNNYFTLVILPTLTLSSLSILVASWLLLRPGSEPGPPCAGARAQRGSLPSFMGAMGADRIDSGVR